MTFEVAINQQQYKFYTLSDSYAQSLIEVVPERGGIITKWRIQGQEIFYLDNERFTHPDLSVRGGVPILFPICGNLPDNTYTHGDRTYTLKQHGFAREMPWLVTDQSTNDCASITLVLTSNDETKAVYPFDFEVSFTYRLWGNSLVIHQNFQNNSSVSMPFSVGLHPYFAALDKTALQVQIPSTEFYDQKTQSTQAFDGEFDYSRDEIDAAFKQLSGESASVKDTSRQLQLNLEWNNDYYNTVVFWTVKDKDFYCLEPWTAPRNALNTGDGLISLPPGDSLQTWVSMNMTFL